MTLNLTLRIRLYLLMIICGFLVGCGSPSKEKSNSPQTQSNEITTNSGLIYEDVVVGQGETVVEGDEVLIEETLTYIDGTLIFSTDQIGQPIKFKVGAGHVIDGLDEGIRGMKTGSQRKLILPTHLSKRTVYPDNLSPDSILIANVKVVQIFKADHTAK